MAPGLVMYHATKWDLEAFSEGLLAEVRTFGIKITIVEPGGSRTGWRAHAVQAQPMDVYADTAVGDYRRNFSASPAPGDPAKMARAIIDAVDRNDPPRRLVLGSDSFEYIHTALRTRLAEVEAQQATASLTDSDDFPRRGP